MSSGGGALQEVGDAGEAADTEMSFFFGIALMDAVDALGVKSAHLLILGNEVAQLCRQLCCLHICRGLRRVLKVKMQKSSGLRDGL